MAVKIRILIYSRFHVTPSVSFRLLDCVNTFLPLDTGLIIVESLWRSGLLWAITSLLTPSPHTKSAPGSVDMEGWFWSPLWHQHLCVLKSLGDGLLGILVRDYFEWVRWGRKTGSQWVSSFPGAGAWTIWKEESKLNTSIHYYWLGMQCDQCPEAPACCGVSLVNPKFSPAAMWLAHASMDDGLQPWTPPLNCFYRSTLSQQQWRKQRQPLIQNSTVSQIS